MIQEYQLRLLPHQAVNEQTVSDFIARDKGIDVRTINRVRILKKSIDARHRTIYVNLSVRVFINEMPTEQAYKETLYHDVRGRKSAVVVGAGPGGGHPGAGAGEVQVVGGPHLVLAAIAQHQKGNEAYIKPIIVLYLIGTFSAALVAVIASFAFPTMLIFSKAGDMSATPPGGIIEVLKTLLMNLSCFRSWKPYGRYALQGLLCVKRRRSVCVSLCNRSRRPLPTSSSHSWKPHSVLRAPITSPRL